jgi:hypothetical protein
LSRPWHRSQATSEGLYRANEFAETLHREPHSFRLPHMSKTLPSN